MEEFGVINFDTQLQGCIKEVGTIDKNGNTASTSIKRLAKWMLQTPSIVIVADHTLIPLINLLNIKKKQRF